MQRLFGARVALGAQVYSSVRTWDPSDLALDAYACLGPRVDCCAMAPISLRRHASVSQGAVLCAAAHAIGDPSFQLTTKPIVIGEGAALGRAVAFSNLASRTVYVGNAARRVKEGARRRAGLR